MLSLPGHTNVYYKNQSVFSMPYTKTQGLYFTSMTNFNHFIIFSHALPIKDILNSYIYFSRRLRTEIKMMNQTEFKEVSELFLLWTKYVNWALNTGLRPCTTVLFIRVHCRKCNNIQMILSMFNCFLILISQFINVLRWQCRANMKATKMRHLGDAKLK